MLDLSPSQIGVPITRMSAAFHGLVDLRPVVGVEAVLAHVRLDSGDEVVVDGSDLVDVHTVFAHDRRAHAHQAGSVGHLR
jgi:hypothetical protein